MVNTGNTQEEATNKNGGTSRRSFLKSFGAFGASGTVELGLSSGIEWVEYESHFRRGEAVKTKKVPKKWWDQSEKAEEVVTHLHQEYDHRSEVSSIVLTTESEKIKHWKYLQARVELHDMDFADEIPDKINGVKIEKTEAKQAALTGESGTGCENQGTFDPIPGGVVHRGADNIGTTCCRIDNDGTHYMLSAAHLFNSCGDNQDEAAYQSDSYTRHYGYVRDWDNTQDWAIIEPQNSNGIDINGKIHTVSDGDVVVAGYLGKKTLEDMMANDDPVMKMGIMTGQSDGVIDSISTSTSADCTDLGGDGVRVTNNQAIGDSGGPVFELGVSNCYMVSLATVGSGGIVGTSCNQDMYAHAEGWPAYKLANNQGFAFYTQ